MAYVPPNTEEVRLVADLAGEDLSPFIATAQAIVDENLVGLGLLSDATLKLICTYLAAHFALLKEGQVKGETIGPSSTQLNMTSGLGLKSTTHGQQAIFLDTTGTLFLLDNRKSETLTPAVVKTAKLTLL